MSSVQITSAGTHGCFLRSKLRLQMWLSCSALLLFSHKILATDRPTLPKPINATRQGTEESPCLEACNIPVFGGFLAKSRSRKNDFHSSYVPKAFPVNCKAWSFGRL